MVQKDTALLTDWGIYDHPQPKDYLKWYIGKLKAKHLDYGIEEEDVLKNGYDFSGDNVCALLGEWKDGEAHFNKDWIREKQKADPNFDLNKWKQKSKYDYNSIDWPSHVQKQCAKYKGLARPHGVQLIAMKQIKEYGINAEWPIDWAIIMKMIETPHYWNCFVTPANMAVAQSIRIETVPYYRCEWSHSEWDKNQKNEESNDELKNEETEIGIGQDNGKSNDEMEQDIDMESTRNEKETLIVIDEKLWLTKAVDESKKTEREEEQAKWARRDSRREAALAEKQQKRLQEAAKKEKAERKKAAKAEAARAQAIRDHDRREKTKLKQAQREIAVKAKEARDESQTQLSTLEDDIATRLHLQLEKESATAATTNTDDQIAINASLHDMTIGEAAELENEALDERFSTMADDGDSSDKESMTKDDALAVIRGMSAHEAQELLVKLLHDDERKTQSTLVIANTESKEERKKRVFAELQALAASISVSNDNSSVSVSVSPSVNTRMQHLTISDSSSHAATDHSMISTSTNPHRGSITTFTNSVAATPVSPRKEEITNEEIELMRNKLTKGLTLADPLTKDNLQQCLEHNHISRTRMFNNVELQLLRMFYQQSKWDAAFNMIIRGLIKFNRNGQIKDCDVSCYSRDIYGDFHSDDDIDDDTANKVVEYDDFRLFPREDITKLKHEGYIDLWADEVDKKPYYYTKRHQVYKGDVWARPKSNGHQDDDWETVDKEYMFVHIVTDNQIMYDDHNCSSTCMDHEELRDGGWRLSERRVIGKKIYDEVQIGWVFREEEETGNLFHVLAINDEESTVTVCEYFIKPFDDNDKCKYKAVVMDMSDMEELYPIYQPSTRKDSGIIAINERQRKIIGIDYYGEICYGYSVDILDDICDSSDVMWRVIGYNPDKDEWTIQRENNTQKVITDYRVFKTYAFYGTEFEISDSGKVEGLTAYNWRKRNSNNEGNNDGNVDRGCHGVASGSGSEGATRSHSGEHGGTSGLPRGSIVSTNIIPTPQWVINYYQKKGKRVESSNMTKYKLTEAWNTREGYDYAIKTGNWYNLLSDVCEKLDECILAASPETKLLSDVVSSRDAMKQMFVANALCKHVFECILEPGSDINDEWVEEMNNKLMQVLDQQNANNYNIMVALKPKFIAFREEHKQTVCSFFIRKNFWAERKVNMAEVYGNGKQLWQCIFMDGGNVWRNEILARLFEFDETVRDVVVRRECFMGGSSEEIFWDMKSDVLSKIQQLNKFSMLGGALSQPFWFKLRDYWLDRAITMGYLKRTKFDEQDIIIASNFVVAAYVFKYANDIINKQTAIQQLHGSATLDIIHGKLKQSNFLQGLMEHIGKFKNATTIDAFKEIFELRCQLHYISYLDDSISESSSNNDEDNDTVKRYPELYNAKPEALAGRDASIVSNHYFVEQTGMVGQPFWTEFVDFCLRNQLVRMYNFRDVTPECLTLFQEAGWWQTVLNCTIYDKLEEMIEEAGEKIDENVDNVSGPIKIAELNLLRYWLCNYCRYVVDADLRKEKTLWSLWEWIIGKINSYTKQAPTMRVKLEYVEKKLVLMECFRSLLTIKMDTLSAKCKHSFYDAESEMFDNNSYSREQINKSVGLQYCTHHSLDGWMLDSLCNFDDLTNRSLFGHVVDWGLGQKQVPWHIPLSRSPERMNVLLQLHTPLPSVHSDIVKFMFKDMHRVYALGNSAEDEAMKTWCKWEMDNVSNERELWENLKLKPNWDAEKVKMIMETADILSLFDIPNGVYELIKKYFPLPYVWGVSIYKITKTWIIHCEMIVFFYKMIQTMYKLCCNAVYNGAFVVNFYHEWTDIKLRTVSFTPSLTECKRYMHKFFKLQKHVKLLKFIWFGYNGKAEIEDPIDERQTMAEDDTDMVHPELVPIENIPKMVRLFVEEDTLTVRYDIAGVDYDSSRLRDIAFGQCPLLPAKTIIVNAFYLLNWVPSPMTTSLVEPSDEFTIAGDTDDNRIRVNDHVNIRCQSGVYRVLFWMPKKVKNFWWLYVKLTTCGNVSTYFLVRNDLCFRKVAYGLPIYTVSNDGDSALRSGDHIIVGNVNTNGQDTFAPPAHLIGKTMRVKDVWNYQGRNLLYVDTVYDAEGDGAWIALQYLRKQ